MLEKPGDAHLDLKECLEELAGSTLELTIVGTDSFSGSRHAFHSRRFTATSIKDGRYEDGKLTIHAS